jgi:hypothetical protein
VSGLGRGFLGSSLGGGGGPCGDFGTVLGDLLAAKRGNAADEGAAVEKKELTYFFG